MNEAKSNRWKKLLIRGLVAVAILILLVVIAIPVVASTSFVKGKVLTAVQSNLNGEVTLGSLDFGWFSGVQLEALAIQQPTGYTGTDALAIPKIDAQIALFSSIFGTPSAEVTVESPVVTIIRNKDARLNWQDLLPTAEASPDGPAKEPEDLPQDLPDEPTSIPDVHVEFRLTNGTITYVDEVTDTQEVLRDLEIEAIHLGGDEPSKVSLHAVVDRGESKRGFVDLEANLDVATQKWEADLDTDGLNLEYWTPLLVALGVPLETLQGSLKGNIHSSGQPGQMANVEGLLTVENFRFKQPTDEREISIPKISIQPNLIADLANNQVNSSDFQIDLGFLTLRGMPQERLPAESLDSKKLALGFELDLNLGGLQEAGILPSMELGGGINVALWASAAKGEGEWLSMEEALQFGVTTAASNLSLPEAWVPAAVALSELNSELRGQFDMNNMDYVVDSISMDSDAFDANGQLGGGTENLGGLLQVNVKQDALRSLLESYCGEHVQADGAMQIQLGIESFAMGGASDLDGLLSALRSNIAIDCPNLAIFENQVTGLGLEMSVADQSAEFGLKDTSQLNGGALKLSGRLGAAADSTYTSDITLGWENGRAGGSLTPGLRYVVPLLAGLGVDDLDALTEIDFSALASFEMSLNGPAFKSEGQTWLDFANAWTGSGGGSLSEGQMGLAGDLAQLTSLLSPDKQRLEFKEIATDFQFVDGRIVVPDLRLTGSEAPLRMSGSTGLDGALDYAIDLSEILASRGTGKKVAEVLGEQELSAMLQGTLDAPSFSLSDLATQSLQNITGSVIDNLKTDPKSTVDGLRNLFKKDDDDQEQPKKPKKKKPKKKQEKKDGGDNDENQNQRP